LTILQGDKEKLQVAGFYEHESGLVALASSTGLRAFHPKSEASFTLTARTPDGSGSGWAGAESHRAADLHAEELARVAIDKAVRSQKPRPLAPGHYTVILEPAAVAELLSFLLHSLDARSADEGRSFFAKPGGGNRLGEKLFPDLISLRSDPTDKDTPGAPFTEEGLPLKPRSLIDKGVVSSLSYSRYWAQKQGKEPTGRPTVAHLLPGRGKTADLYSGVQRGVLITRFWYTRWVDPQSLLITGLTRDGVFLIENGQVTAPVNNFRFNESPVTMLKNADVLTEQTVRAPNSGMLIRVPALRTHDFNLASVSEAI
jgi:predicted Zn-dependent protease